MNTTPLAKSITTLEGQLVLATSVVLGAGAALAPGTLPPKWAAVVVGVEHVALLAQRAVVKVQASKLVAQVVDSPAPLKAAEAAVERYLAVEPDPGRTGVAVPVNESPKPVDVSEGGGSDDTADYAPDHGLAPGDQS